MYSIIPVSGIDNLEAVRDDLMDSPELHTLILLNIGSILDLPSPEWFGDFPQADLSVHIVDSARPQNLSSLFGTGPGSERIVVWDDGGASKLQEERNAWLALEVRSRVLRTRFECLPTRFLATRMSRSRTLTLTRILMMIWTHLRTKSSRQTQMKTNITKRPVAGSAGR